MSKITGLLCVVGLLHISYSFAEHNFETYSFIDSHSYSEIAPIKQVIDGLEGDPIDSGSFAFTHNQFEVGQRWNGFELAAFWRYDYYLEFDKDTAQLVYLDKNDVAPEPGREYDVFLKANHLVSRGVGLGYSYDFNPGLTGRVRLNYLTASEMLDGDLKGRVSTDTSTYAGDLQLDYGYSEDILLDREKESVRGKGYSVDVDLFWQVTDRLDVVLRGRDVYSRIRWKDLTYTRATATTDRISYDEDGNLQSIPGIQGVEGYRNHTQQLPERYWLAGHYALNDNWTASAEVFSYDAHLFPRVMLGRQWGALSVQASYDLEAQALGVGLTNRYVQFLLRADDADWEKAKALELLLNVSVHY